VLGYPAEGGERSNRIALYGTADVRVEKALKVDERNPFANFVKGELRTDEGVKAHKYTNPEKFRDAERYLRKALDAAGDSGEAQYEAMYARALAGQGRYDEAIAKLLAIKKAKDANAFLVEWVWGEVLYNYAGQNQNGTLLDNALEHLNHARDLRSCGARADQIQDLIQIVETERKIETERKNRPPADLHTSPGVADIPMEKRDKQSGAQQFGGVAPGIAPDGLIERRSGGPGAPGLESELPNATPAKPDTEAVAPATGMAKPQPGAMNLESKVLKPQLVTMKMDPLATSSNAVAVKPEGQTVNPPSSGPESRAATQVSPHPMPDQVTAGPTIQVWKSAKNALPELKPACREYWPELTGDPVLLRPPLSAAATAVLPVFDAYH
jgi:hypothetical protein